MKSIRFLFVSAFFLIAPTSLFAQNGGPVIIRISNVPADQGKVLLATGDGKYYGMADATSTTVDIKLDNIPDGKYTVSLLSDKNLSKA